MCSRNINCGIFNVIISNCPSSSGRRKQITNVILEERESNGTQTFEFEKKDRFIYVNRGVVENDTIKHLIFLCETNPKVKHIIDDYGNTFCKVIEQDFITIIRQMDRRSIINIDDTILK